MKTIKSFLLAAIIATSTVLSASTEPIKKAEETVITNEVKTLLKSPLFELEKDVIADVRLTVNKDNEIVVLSVDTEDNQIADFIKSRLNYKKLTEDVKVKTYILPVRITPSE